MSIVSILVFASQAARRLAFKVKNKAIHAVQNRIKLVEAEQVKVEEHRSKLMIDCHNNFYKEDGKLVEERDAAIRAILAKFDAKQDKLAVTFHENKRTIALTHQAASNQLKGELVALRSELDHLTK